MPKIKVQPSLILMLLLLIIGDHFLVAISYAAAVVLHEFAHAALAYKIGFELRDIKLNPYGASLTGAFEGVKPRDEILIAAIGPLTNAFIAVVFVAVWWLSPEVFFYTRDFVLANVYTFVFNLIPIFPLDGGRLILALLSTKIQRQKAYKILRWFGIVAGAIFIVGFCLSWFFGANFTLFVVGVFILLSTFSEDKNSKYQRLYSMAFRKEKLEKGLRVRHVAVMQTATLFQLVKMQNSNYFYVFVVLNSALKEVAKVTEAELEKLLAKNDLTKTIIEVLSVRPL